MKTALIVVGVVLLIAMMVLLYLLIGGADKSRRKDRDRYKDRQVQEK